MQANRVEIPRTSVEYWPDAAGTRDADLRTNVQFSIWLNAGSDRGLDAARARSIGGTSPALRTYEEMGALRARSRCGTNDLERVQRYCNEHGLETLRVNWRSLDVHGPLSAAVAAFGGDVVSLIDGEGRPFRSRRGSLSAESGIAPLIRGVFGFSQWPRARRLGALQRHATPLSLDELARRYALPDATGSGSTIGIIQLGGEFRADDFSRCMTAQGLTREMPVVKRIDDAPGAHALATSQDLESALDAQIAGALAPGARIVVYRASDSERGLLDAVRTAVFDEEHRPSILSISYGWPESRWTPAAIDILNDLFIAAAMLGISVVCASGDNGAELDASGAPHVLFPASSPYVLACGATAIADDGASEAAWERTGGGFSETFPKPDWQTARNGSGRGVPDVAAQQHPGFYVMLEGVELAAGGTSAVAPMWAALIARINERMAAHAGFFSPLLYRTPNICAEVLNGSNGFFNAVPGWNACTGLGVPNGRALESALRA